MTTSHRAIGAFGGAPVFVDASGRRRRALTLLGYLGAAACAAYVAAFGVTMTTDAGAISELAGPTLTPTPPTDEGDDSDGDGAAGATLPVTSAPSVAPAVTTQARVTTARPRTVARTVELRRRPAAVTTHRHTAAPRMVHLTPVRRTAPTARPVAPARTVAPAPTTARPAGTTTPRTGTTGTTPRTGTTSPTGTTPRTGTGSTAGTGTTTGSGTGAGSGTGSRSGGTGRTTTTTGLPTTPMDAATSDVLTLGPPTVPGPA